MEFFSIMFIAILAPMIYGFKMTDSIDHIVKNIIQIEKVVIDFENLSYVQPDTTIHLKLVIREHTSGR